MFRLIGAASALLAVVASHPARAGVIIDFSGFPVGVSAQQRAPDGTLVPQPVNGTHPDVQAFSIRDASIDTIVNVGGTHGNVWQLRESNGNLQTRPHSPHAGNLPPGDPNAGQKQFSGETGAWDDFGSETTTTHTFYAELAIKSVLGSAGTNFSFFDIYPNVGDDGRQAYIRLTDDGATGFDMTFYQTGPGGFSDFQAFTYNTNISYGDWHTLGVGITFVDGLANDVVQYFLDGALVHTGTSWETGYQALSHPVRGLDRLAFFAGTNGLNGLYLDDIRINDEIPTGASPAGFALLNAQAVPEPSSMGLCALGLIGMMGRTWRRRSTRAG